MKKYEIVKDNNYFNKIIKEGFCIKNKFYLIYIMKSELQRPRFGIAVGTKIGNAVTRNKIKRQIRNIVTKHKKLFKDYYDYIIITKKSCKDEKYDKLDIELQELIKKGDINNA